MELLKQLFAIHSPSGNETRIRKFIKRWVKQNVPGCQIKGDQWGNMYLTKGLAEKYPCLCAHLDQVQKAYPQDYMVCSNSDVIFAYSPSMRQFCGLGADDKCGIWIALKCLAEFPVLKVAFFSGEEIGCVGSSRADMSFFDDTMYIVEADRRGAKDLIVEIGMTELCSDEFVKATNCEAFGYNPTHGMMTDVETLRSRGYANSCINLSCGYYDPHTDHEFVSINDLLNALNFVRNIVSSIKHEMPAPKRIWGDDDVYDYSMGYDWAEEALYEYLDALGDEVKSIPTEDICLDVCDWLGLSKKRAKRIINDWKLMF